MIPPPRPSVSCCVHTRCLIPEPLPVLAPGSVRMPHGTKVAHGRLRARQRLHPQDGLGGAEKPHHAGLRPGRRRRGTAAGGTFVTVTRVVDDDTIEVPPAVRGATDVRLIGVDTPETFGGEEACGPEASAFTARHLEGERVRLELDEDPFDPYDRFLAYVWLDGEMFNERLLEAGLASQVTYQPNDKYEGRLIAAASRARTPPCATETTSPTLENAAQPPHPVLLPRLMAAPPRPVLLPRRIRPVLRLPLTTLPPLVP